MTKTVNLTQYTEFVAGCTSDESNDIDKMLRRAEALNVSAKDVNIALLLTGAIGLSSESGEFAEIIKKCLFQGKPLDADTIFHAKRELGDIIWYWTNSCRALGLDPNEVIAENVEKLKARYPGGEFDVYYSENRKEGDL